MVEIVDGSGAGNRAQVTSKNELLTKADSITEEHRVSLFDESAYFMSVALGANDTLTLANGATASILLLQSLDVNQVLVVENIFASTDTNGITLKIIRNPTIGTLAQNTAVIPANLNFSSTKTANVNAQVWDETGGNGIQGLTGGSDVKSYILGIGTIPLPIDGAIILDQNDAIVLQMTNPTGGSAEVEVGIRFYNQIRE